jgi:type IV fimbrial biogenesis protein FimT
MPLASNQSFETKNTSLGFTLLELMITVAIAAILLSVAIPSFFASIRSNRLTTDANQLVTAFNLARSEAVKRGGSVTVRRVDANSSTNLGAAANWEDGWDVFVDQNANGNFNDDGDANLCETAPAEDCLLKTYPALNGTYTLRGDANFTAFIRYMNNGRSNTAGFFVLCEDSDNNAVPEANTSRVIEVNAVGRVSMGVDANNNQIPERNGADIATCQP